MKKFDMKNLSYDTKLVLISDVKYPFERVIQLIDEKSSDVMILAALQRKDATSEFLHKYVRHESEKVRKKVAAHPNVFLEDLEILIDDLIENVSISALFNEKITNEMISKKIDKFNLDSCLSIQYAKALISIKVITESQIKKIWSVYAQKFELDFISKKGICELAEQLIIKVDTKEELLEEILDWLCENDDIIYDEFKVILEKLIIYHSECEKIIFKYWNDFLTLLVENKFYIISASHLFPKTLEKLWNHSSFKLNSSFLFEIAASSYLTDEMAAYITYRLLLDYSVNKKSDFLKLA